MTSVIFPLKIPDLVYNCFSVPMEGKEAQELALPAEPAMDQSPDDAQSAKPVASNGPSATPGQQNNCTPVMKRKYTKVKGSPRSPFSEVDEFQMLLTHFHCVKKNVENWAPWTNHGWDSHAPECLLKRHPAESLRKHWNSTFALYGRRDELIAKALAWTSGSNFMELARKNIMSSPILMEWANKAHVNLRLQEAKLIQMGGLGSPWCCSSEMKAKQEAVYKEKGISIPGVAPGEAKIPIICLLESVPTELLTLRSGTNWKNHSFPSARKF
jgi:hypothetical protein